MITLVIGRRVQGKTTLAYRMASRQPTVVIFDPRGTFEIDKRSEGLTLYEQLDSLPRVVVHPHGNVPMAFAEFCETLKDWIQDNPSEPLALLVDEARFIDTPSEIPPACDHIIRFSDTALVQIYFTAHRPSDIAVDIRAIADFWCVFRSTQEHDLKVIAERCGSEVADQVRTLGSREFIVWNDGQAKAHVNRTPSGWYMPLNVPLLKPTQQKSLSEVRA